MGQYHYTVNLDKREFIDPHKLGDGMKLLEQTGWSPGGVNDALHLLLAVCSGRGGGDFQSETGEFVGRWGGDRITIIGDYAEPSDVPDGCSINMDDYTDITEALIPTLEREYECVYVGDGWRTRVSLDSIEGYFGSAGKGDRMIMFKDGTEHPSSVVREQLKSFLSAGGHFHGDPIPLAKLFTAHPEP